MVDFEFLCFAFLPNNCMVQAGCKRLQRNINTTFDMNAPKALTTLSF